MGGPPEICYSRNASRNALVCLRDTSTLAPTPRSSSILPPTIAFVTTNPSATALLVSGEVGRECLLRSSHDLVSWHITHRILTTSPHTLFPADLNATRQFYQAMFR